MEVTDNKVSVYGEGEIEQKVWMDNIAKIKKAFPKIKPEWLDILAERIKDKGFTNKKFMDAVNKMIDTCPYPEPTIAEILNYDHRVECLSEFEMMEKVTKQGDSVRYEYSKADINGELYYVKNKDFKEYGFKEFTPKQIKVEYVKHEIPKEDREKTASILRDAINSLNITEV